MDGTTPTPCDPLLDTLEAASYLRFRPASLVTWRSRRVGPSYEKVGSKVFYRQSALDAWREARTVHHEPETA